MEDMISSIANLGFPIALSMYLLIRIEGKLDKLSEAISDLNRTLKCDI